MKTQFDKIYVISLISNKDRQEFIKQQMNDLEIDFEFIYGINFTHFKKDFAFEDIKYPKVYGFDNNQSPEGLVRSYGCTMSHYRAVVQAYELGYNNVLIIEDDICFIKDKELLKYYLNNIPQDCDVMLYVPRAPRQHTVSIFIKNILINKSNKKYFYNISNNWENDIDVQNDGYSNEAIFGAICYGLMNRKTMKLYLDYQRNELRAADLINDIFTCNTYTDIIKYIPTKCIATDQFNIYNNFDVDKNNLGFQNIYKYTENLFIDKFYIPQNYSLFTREIP